jgi:hypothetical protein
MRLNPAQEQREENVVILQQNTPVYQKQSSNLNAERVSLCFPVSDLPRKSFQK